MQPQLANVVHPVIARGLDLYRRLKRLEQPDLDTEQAILKDLLQSDFQARQYAEFGPDFDRPRGGPGRNPDAQNSSGYTDTFLGVRYALVCWLDELFTRDDSDWARRWNEQKLEIELYGSNDRAWKFWQQAQLVQSRAGDDALETFYLCVMLGFRGDLRNHDKELGTWTANARHRLGNIQDIQSPRASALDFAPSARPLYGSRKLSRMVITGWVALLALVPMAAFVFVWKLGR